MLFQLLLEPLPAAVEPLEIFLIDLSAFDQRRSRRLVALPDDGHLAVVLKPDVAELVEVPVAALVQQHQEIAHRKAGFVEIRRDDFPVLHEPDRISVDDGFHGHVLVGEIAQQKQQPGPEADHGNQPEHGFPLVEQGSADDRAECDVADLVDRRNRGERPLAGQMDVDQHHQEAGQQLGQDIEHDVPQIRKIEHIPPSSVYSCR